MGLKPIDAQVNILQMNSAAKEINKQKFADINKQTFAASLVEQESIEKKSKVEKTEKVESLIAPLENEVKDRRSKKEKNSTNEKGKKENQISIEDNEKGLFSDPSKGFLIDIKE